MALLTIPLMQWLRASSGARLAAEADNRPEPDPVRVVNLFNPRGFATWLATELGEVDDTLFGLPDLGFGCPELGAFSLHEIASLRLPRNLRIECDRYFVTRDPLSVWAEMARKTGSIKCAEQQLREPRDQLPS
jgi:hypothetical protein